MKPNVFISVVLLSIFYGFSSATTTATTTTTKTSTIMTLELEPNPPHWPESVIFIRDTEDPETIQSKLQHTQDSWQKNVGGVIETFTCDHHFSNRRYAVLFAPGVYNNNIRLEVGYYVQVAGLGVKAEDVSFQQGGGPYVPALNRHLHHHGANGTKHVGTCLDTFWRSGENFSIENMKWAVSQAAPLRRVQVQGDLWLHDGEAYASGGHLANAAVQGRTRFGGQQQYLSRSVQFGQGASGGAWGMVYVGCQNAPMSTNGTPNNTDNNNSAATSITTVDSAPIRIEKPYVAVYPEDPTKFQLRVPQLTHKSGPLLNGEDEESRDFSHVKVATTQDSTAAIQLALDQGKDVVLTPGIYHLDQTLQIHTANQVVLGLGLATLVAPPHAPCLHVLPNTPGVRIAGIMLEAPPVDPLDRNNSNNNNNSHWSLLEFGTEGVKDQGDDANNPGALFDIFCRVGGGGPASQRKWISIDTMVRIHSSHVLGDNLWLWRADHAQLDLAADEPANCPQVSSVFYQTEQNEYNVDTGLVVTGDHVTIYGLAVEHTTKHQTIWKGEHGTVFFYQCEFPYDVGPDFGHQGYRGYKIDARQHQLYSPGIYSNFRNGVVSVDTAIEFDANNNNNNNKRPNGIQIVNPFTVHLDNHGLIQSVVNGQGPPASQKGTPTRIITESVA